MNSPFPSDSPEHPHFDEVLADYMQRLDQGESVDREGFVAQHPDVADELRSYFNAVDDVALFRHVSPEEAGFLPSNATPQPIWIDEDPLVKPRIRYLGDYELLEEIAQGGMGVIYRARQRSLRRLVALKMIRAGALASLEDVHRFHAEAEAAARLDHPHIVPIYEVGEHGGQHYYSMKLVEGGNLKRHMPALRSDVRRAARLLASAARAVHHAHQRGILHRDLKPANILLDDAGQPHVTDFGLAKMIEGEGALTLPGLIIGTPTYMAPEQAAGDVPLTTAADVYSLGAILYEVLAGRPPFREATPIATVVQLLQHDPPPPHALNPGKMDRNLEAICLKALDKTPERRYGSAEALADDLERWLADDQVEARTPSRLERAARYARRFPARLILFVLLGMIVPTGLVGLIWHWHHVTTEQALAGQRWEVEQRLRYQRAIAHAQSACEDGDLTRALRLLQDAATGPDPGWELAYLRGLVHGHTTLTLRGHEGDVLAVAFHPDGQRLATAGADGTVRLWRRDSGQALAVWRENRASVQALAFHPDGKRLASAGADRVVRLWDVDSGKCLIRWQDPSLPLQALAFSAEGRWLAASGGTSSLDGDPGQGELHIWDCSQGVKVLTEKMANRVGSLAFSARGETLACTCDDLTLTLREGPHFAPKRVLRIPQMGPGQSPFSPWSGVAFNPEGTLVAASSLSGRLMAWDPQGHVVFNIPGSGWEGLSGLAFAPRGRSLLAAGGDDNVVRIWGGTTGTPIREFRGHARPVTALAFSPEGNTLATASRDQTVRIWEIPHGESRHVLRGHSGPLHTVAFRPGSTDIATGGTTHTLRIWDSQTDRTRLRLRHPDEVCSVAYNREGTLLATGDPKGIVRLWNSQTGELLANLPGHEDVVTCLRFSPVGERLASACGDGSIRVLETTSHTLVWSSEGHPKGTQALVFSSDGSLVASVGSDGKIRIWDAVNGTEKRTWEAHEGCARAIVFTPDGRHLVSGGDDGTVRLWDAANGNELGRFEGHTDSVLTLAIEPGGRIASAGRDRTVKIWDPSTRLEFLTLRGHTREVRALAFSPTGDRLLSVSADHTLRTWNARSEPDPDLARHAE